jgi:hypothetical protein
MAKPDSHKLVCTACKHENEPERVYCHNCGEKLDRSLLPKAEDLTSGEEFSKKQKQVQKMMNRSRGRWVATARKLILLVLLSAFVAAGFLVCQAPQDAPPMQSDELSSVDSRELWKMLINTPQAAVPFKESDLNHTIRQSVKPGPGPLGTKFVRAFVTLRPGKIALNTQRDAWGLPIYTGATLKPVIVGGKWSPGIEGLSIGRLKIHPAARKLADFVLDPFAKAFEAQLKEIDRLQKIEPGEKVVTFSTKAPQ